jgi:hypothetical protein
MAEFYRDAHGSMVKFCRDFTEANPAWGLEVYDFDAHVANQEFPDADILGPYQFQFSIDGGVFTIMTMVGVSTRDDPNLFKLRDVTSRLYEQLLPSRIIQLYDSNTVTPRGVMKAMDGTALSPVARTNSRPFQYIAVSFGCDQSMMV